MKWLLDTTVVAATRRPERSDPRVVSWLEAQSPYSLHISAITVFELERAAALTARADQERGERVKCWVDEVVDVFADRILPLDTAVATVAAGYREPEPDSVVAVIAATATVAGLGVVTENPGEFRRFRVPVFSPWESSA